VKLGRPAVPYILEELRRDPDHWFAALYLITGENPVPQNFTGTVEEAADLWVRWGERAHAAQRAPRALPAR
jgi:hypothetical protein